jgi:hypothetical protein
MGSSKRPAVTDALTIQPDLGIHHQFWADKPPEDGFSVAES